MRSVVAELGTTDFPRLRLGIGPLPDGRDAADFVLTRFARAERQAFDAALGRAAEAVEAILLRGVERANRLLTAEVNAAVDGLEAAGATEVIVMDGHGPGAIVYEELDPRASLIHGRPASPRWRDEVRGCDATVFVGQHAMAATPDANMNHTQDERSITSISLNGELIGETAQWALYAGSWGVPAIFLAGDEAACREFEALVPGGVTAAVKRGLGRSTAVSVSAQRARKLIRDLQRSRNMAVMFITHDFGVIANICHRVAVMYAGKIVETAPTRELFNNPRHPYTVALMESVPRLDRKTDRLYSIKGQPPSLGNLPSGCRFHPRCPLAGPAGILERCRTEEPPLIDLGDGRQSACWLAESGNPLPVIERP